MMRSDFAAFIISHGRPDNVITYNTLRRCGYSGKIYIVIDNVDSKGDEYRKIYGEDVLVFDKPAIAQTTDNGDNFKNYRSTTHARNACFDLAEGLGIRYFIVFDDDYTHFQFKFDSKPIFKNSALRRLDDVIDAYLDFYKSADFLSIAFAQGGDFMGGPKGSFGMSIQSKRKAMNSFFCDTKRRYQYLSRLNEDVNTYLTLGVRGEIFLTPNLISLNQMQTQTNSGGMSEAYLQSGTYVKTFYSIMYCPSFVKVNMMGPSHPRLHHRVTWKHAVPKIISEEFRKTASMRI